MEGTQCKCLVPNVLSNVTIVNVPYQKIQVKICIFANLILSKEEVEQNRIKNPSSVTCVTENLTGKLHYSLIWLQLIQKNVISLALIVISKLKSV